MPPPSTTTARPLNAAPAAPFTDGQKLQQIYGEFTRRGISFQIAHEYAQTLAEAVDLSGFRTPEQLQEWLNRLPVVDEAQILPGLRAYWDFENQRESLIETIERTRSQANVNPTPVLTQGELDPFETQQLNLGIVDREVAAAIADIGRRESIMAQLQQARQEIRRLSPGFTPKSLRANPVIRTVEEARPVALPSLSFSRIGARLLSKLPSLERIGSALFEFAKPTAEAGTEAAGAALRTAGKVAGLLGLLYTIGDGLVKTFTGTQSKQLVLRAQQQQLQTQAKYVRQVIRHYAEVANGFMRQAQLDLSRAVANSLQPNITVDAREFQKRLNLYAMLSKKSLGQICNEKGYNVALRSYGFTDSVSKQHIQAELSATARDYNAPLALILLEARKANKQGLKGRALQQHLSRAVYLQNTKRAISQFINTRKRSVNFLKSGWIPAIQYFARVLGKSTKAKPSRGTPKGGGEKANNLSLKPKSSLWNDVQGGKVPQPRVHDLIAKGAQKALDAEAANMEKYILNKLKANAYASGIIPSQSGEPYTLGALVNYKT